MATDRCAVVVDAVRVILTAALVLLFADAAAALPPLQGSDVVVGYDSETTYTTSWIGNSFPGGRQWVQIFGEGLYVLPDGTSIVHSHWDEANRDAGAYDANGRPVGKVPIEHEGNLCTVLTGDDDYLYISAKKNGVWDIERHDAASPWDSASFVGGDDERLIIEDPGAGGTNSAGGEAIEGVAVAPGEALFVADGWTDEIRVFVLGHDGTGNYGEGNSDDDTIIEDTGFAVSVTRVGAIVYDASQSRLWVVQRPSDDFSSPAKIICFNWNAATGLSSNSTQIQADSNWPNHDRWNPAALAINRVNGQLMVADNGPNQQILMYAANGTLTGTLGVRGGVFTGANPGAVRDDTLVDLTGVGSDASGNIYTVGRGDGTDLRKYNSSGELQWATRSMFFLNGAGLDPLTWDAFSPQSRMAMDYTKPPGKEWSWAAYTEDDFTYPDEVRVHWTAATAIVRRLNGGKRYVYLLADKPHMIAVLRQDDDERLITSAMVGDGWHKSKTIYDGYPWGRPDFGYVYDATSGQYEIELNTEGKQVQINRPWAWADSDGQGDIDAIGANGTSPINGSDTDANEFTAGNETDYQQSFGYYVDSQGTIWDAAGTSAVRKMAIKQFDSQGNPVYSFDSPYFDQQSLGDLHIPASDLNRLMRIVYDPATDTMYLNGFNTTYDWNDYKDAGAALAFDGAGPVILKYSNWSNPTLDASGNRVADWKLVLPFKFEQDPDGSLRKINWFDSFAVVGDRLFVLEDFYARIMVYDVNNTEYHPEVSLDMPVLKKTLATGPEVYGKVGWPDIPVPMQVFQRDDGEYLVTVEEDAEGKNLFYRFPARPLNAERIYLEAEDGTLDSGSDFQLMDYANGASKLAIRTSQGKYLEVADDTASEGVPPTDAKKLVQYNLTLQQGGDYVILGRTHTVNTHSNSFWVHLQGPNGYDSGWKQWATVSDNHWIWNRVNDFGDDASDPLKVDPTIFSGLVGGSYTLTIGISEDGKDTNPDDGPGLDRLLVTNDALWGGSVPTYSSTTQSPYGGIARAIPGQIEAEDYDLGGEGVAYHDTSTGNTGGQYRTDDVDITAHSGGGYNVGYIIADEWLEYTTSVASSGDYDLKLRLATPNSGKTLHVEVDGTDVTGAVAVPDTGDWSTYQTVTVTGVSLSAGQRVVRAFFDTGSINLDWITFEAGDTGGGGGGSVVLSEDFEDQASTFDGHTVVAASAAPSGGQGSYVGMTQHTGAGTTSSSATINPEAALDGFTSVQVSFLAAAQSPAAGTLRYKVDAKIRKPDNSTQTLRTIVTLTPNAGFSTYTPTISLSGLPTGTVLIQAAVSFDVHNGVAGETYTAYLDNVTYTLQGDGGSGGGGSGGGSATLSEDFEDQVSAFDGHTVLAVGSAPTGGQGSYVGMTQHTGAGTTSSSATINPEASLDGFTSVHISFLAAAQASGTALAGGATVRYKVDAKVRKPDNSTQTLRTVVTITPNAGFSTYTPTINLTGLPTGTVLIQAAVSLDIHDGVAGETYTAYLDNLTYTLQ